MRQVIFFFFFFFCTELKSTSRRSKWPQTEGEQRGVLQPRRSGLTSSSYWSVRALFLRIFMGRAEPFACTVRVGTCAVSCTKDVCPLAILVVFYLFIYCIYLFSIERSASSQTTNAATIVSTLPPPPPPSPSHRICQLKHAIHFFYFTPMISLWMQQPKCVGWRRMHDALCLAASTRSLLSSLHLKVTPPAACLLLFRIDTGVILPPVLPVDDTLPIQQIGFTVSLRQHWNSISKKGTILQSAHTAKYLFFLVIKLGWGLLGAWIDAALHTLGNNYF